MDNDRWVFNPIRISNGIKNELVLVEGSPLLGANIQKFGGFEYNLTLVAIESDTPERKFDRHLCKCADFGPTEGNYFYFTSA